MNVTTIRKRPIAGRYLESSLESLRVEKEKFSRFQWLSKCVQVIFYLARLLSDLVKWAGIVGRIVASLATELVIQPQVIPCSTPDLCHGVFVSGPRAEGKRRKESGPFVRVSIL